MRAVVNRCDDRAQQTKIPRVSQADVPASPALGALDNIVGKLKVAFKSRKEKKAEKSSKKTEPAATKPEEHAPVTAPVTAAAGAAGTAAATEPTKTETATAGKLPT